MKPPLAYISALKRRAFRLSCYFCNRSQEILYLYSLGNRNFRLMNLGEGFAIDADKDREIAYLTSLLKDNGIEPYSLPSGDRTEDV